MHDLGKEERRSHRPRERGDAAGFLARGEHGWACSGCESARGCEGTSGPLARSCLGERGRAAFVK